MPDLIGSSQAISLGQGYALRSPGIRGTAELLFPRSAADRSRSRIPEDGTPALDAALAATNVTEVRIIELHLVPTSPADAIRALRGVDGEETLELEVPDLGPETGQVVLSCDEAGVLRWHFPVDEHLRVQSPTTRGAGGVKRFRIPNTQTRPAPASDAARRSLLGVIGRKLLKILIYPVTDPVIGAIGEFSQSGGKRSSGPTAYAVLRPRSEEYRTSARSFPLTGIACVLDARCCLFTARSVLPMPPSHRSLIQHSPRCTSAMAGACSPLITLRCHTIHGAMSSGCSAIFRRGARLRSISFVTAAGGSSRAPSPSARPYSD